MIRSNVENMPYLRNLSEAREVAQARLQKASSIYQRLLEERNRLIAKGREYLHRAKLAENEGLYEQGQSFMAQANKINEKMLGAYREYKEAESALTKLSR